jgi:hypothetical protein
MNRGLRWIAHVIAVGGTLAVAVLAVLALSGPADAVAPDPHIPHPPLPIAPIPIPPVHIPGFGDCKDAPVPDTPGSGIAGFFDRPPRQLPPAEDPFGPGATTTIYEQYGYAGLRWRTYDLGCGPDAMRNPDAVIGTAVSNWMMQIPLAVSAATGSLTKVAFHPTFLQTFNPVVEKVSTTLHTSLFASWVPLVLALLGGLIVVTARRAALSSTASAVGWALIVMMVATALFRWPLAAGQFADNLVGGTLGQAVGQLDGTDVTDDPGIAVASHVEESILYRSWLAGTLGSPDSETARKYGPDLFKAQALTWREADLVQRDPEKGKALIEYKQNKWKEIAAKIQKEDPDAYENLTGKRSETRVGYAILSSLATLLSLPFLMASSLLMLGCFIIVRLAVMIFPVFAILGMFPQSRGIVLGLGRGVGAAVVNAIIFGIGAGVTVAVLGILFHPGNGTPGWLSLILMPLFSFIMWAALKPFRRLTTMVGSNRDHLGDGIGSFGRAARSGGQFVRQAAVSAVGAAAGGAGGAAAAAAIAGDDDDPPDRVEAQPTPPPALARRTPLALTAAPAASAPPDRGVPWDPRPGTPPRGSTSSPDPRVAPALARHSARSTSDHIDEYAPTPNAESAPMAPTEPEWYDGEDVYPLYRPAPDEFGDNGDAA